MGTWRRISLLTRMNAFTTIWFVNRFPNLRCLIVEYNIFFAGKGVPWSIETRLGACFLKQVAVLRRYAALFKLKAMVSVRRAYIYECTPDWLCGHKTTF